MGRFSRGLGLAVALLALADAGAVAQENLDQGKTGAQLYASDCAICHKSPQKLALSSAGGIFGLGGFLREHYTASRESAAAITAYLSGIQRGARAPVHRRTKKSKASASASAKPKQSE